MDSQSSWITFGPQFKSAFQHAKVVALRVEMQSIAKSGGIAFKGFASLRLPPPPLFRREADTFSRRQTQTAGGILVGTLDLQK